MANHYELLTIVNGIISDTELDTVRVSLDALLKKHTAAIHYIHNLGRRKLAYPIKHQMQGTYLLCEFDANAEEIKKLERALSLTPELLRHCIVKRKKVGTPTPLERREEETLRRTTTPRKTQDEALLGSVPLVEDVPATPVTTEEPIMAKTALPASPTVSDDHVTPHTNEEEAEGEEIKKKGKKVSYEELDKKLNELLSDDII